jgi:hypothetical protein
MRWSGLVEDEKCCRIVVRNPEGKTSLGRYRLTWEDNIKVDPKEIGCEDLRIFSFFSLRALLYWAVIQCIMHKL